MGISPLTANSLPGGALAGNGWCAVEYTPGALDCEWKFRHENQLGSLIGVTNLDGNRIAELDYGEYGQTYPKHILWDGPVDVAHSQSAGSDTFLVYTPLGFGFPLGLENALLRCVHPGFPNPAAPDRPKHATFATVKGYGVDTTPGPTFGQNYLIVEDLRGHVAEAILEIGCDVTVLANYSQVVPGTEPVTSGHWDDVVYDSLTDTTTFTDNGATFPPHAVNWWLQPNAAISVYLDIVSIGTGQVIVAGDATGLAHGLIPQPPLDPILGTFYTIIWPAGVDPASGTLAHNDPCEPVSRLLFAGYYYMPPVAGTLIQPPGGGTGPHGQQPGANHHGDYYCWNRVYAQKNGRWTTPDPAKSPEFNLVEYCHNAPAVRADVSGLKVRLPGGVAYNKLGIEIPNRNEKLEKDRSKFLETINKALGGCAVAEADEVITTELRWVWWTDPMNPQTKQVSKTPPKGIVAVREDVPVRKNYYLKLRERKDSVQGPNCPCDCKKLLSLFTSAIDGDFELGMVYSDTNPWDKNEKMTVYGGAAAFYDKGPFKSVVVMGNYPVSNEHATTLVHELLGHALHYALGKEYNRVAITVDNIARRHLRCLGAQNLPDRDYTGGHEEAEPKGADLHPDDPNYTKD